LSGYATEAYVTTVSGDIISQIPTDFYSQAEVTTISGDIVAQIPTDYVTATELTTVSGDIMAQIPLDYPTTLTGLSDVPEIYGENLYLGYGSGYFNWNQGTIVPIPAAIGQYLYTANYMGTPLMDWTDDVINTAKITTISGDIVAQIPDVSDFITADELTTTSGDIVSQFPSDFYTRAEVTTISGDIVAQFPSLSGYATEAYVTTVSGDIVAQIPSDYVSDTEMTTISGDIVAQFPDTSEFLTATEITTISGDIVAQFPTDFYSQSEVDNLLTTTSGDILTYVSANYIDTTEMTTISGDLVTYVDDSISTLSGSIVLDHGGLTGLEDDDHTQYILVNGTRAFSATVSGVTPTVSGHLATKGYVDALIGTVMEGIDSIGNGDTSVVVSLPDSFDDTTYVINYSIKNVTDANPAQYGSIVTAKAVNSFTVLLSAPTDSANYVVEWRCSDQDRSGLGGGEVNTASNLGAGEGVYAQKSTYDLQFRSLVGAGSITLTSGSETITISGAAAGVGDSTLGSDHSYYANAADVDTVTVDDGSAVFGNALYIAADFHYERCDADAEATMPCRGIALEDGSGSKLILRRGKIRDDTWNWSAGPIYVSTTTGGLTQSAPSGSGDVVQVVGHALSADIAYIDVMRDYVVII
jgi:DUF4097 and DUF4098 domain-containing protein YvlB